jgi:hypothetical protein
LSVLLSVETTTTCRSIVQINKIRRPLLWSFLILLPPREKQKLPNPLAEPLRSERDKRRWMPPVKPFSSSREAFQKQRRPRLVGQSNKGLS